MATKTTLKPIQGLGGAFGAGASKLSTALKTPTSSSVLKPGGLAILSGYTAPTMPANKPGIVPQVYPGSTGRGSNQNVSTSNYGGYTAPTYAPAPTSYLAGSVLGASTQASTPILTGKIPMTSLSSSSATSTPSGATYAGASPIPVPSAPSTNYNAMNNNAQYGATGTTGLFETANTNADGTVKITPTTGEMTVGEKMAQDYGFEKAPSLTDEYYDSPAYKAQQRMAEQMNNTQNQINAVTTRLNLDLQNLRGVGAREGVTEAVYGQQSSQIIREGNNLLLPLQAQLAADQGNLKLATDTLDTWAKLRQADIDNEYSYKKQIATWLRENATAEQKAKVDAAEKIADRQHDVDMANLNYDLSVKKDSITGTSNSLLSDPAQLVAYAQQYASTGMIPTGLPKGSFGAVSAYAKELPKSQGQILDKATGVTPDKLGAAGDAYGALYSAIELSKQLKELDKKRVGGVVSGTLGKVFGSADQQRYVDLRSQIVDLLSRARSGAALTESEEKRYGNMLPGRFSESFGLGANSDVRIDNFTTALTSDLTNKVNSKGWVVNGISKVDLGGTKYTVGDVIEVNGVRGRINADGSITKL
jgi:hypothetical protein